MAKNNPFLNRQQNVAELKEKISELSSMLERWHYKRQEAAASFSVKSEPVGDHVLLTGNGSTQVPELGTSGHVVDQNKREAIQHEVGFVTSSEKYVLPVKSELVLTHSEESANCLSGCMRCDKPLAAEPLSKCRVRGLSDCGAYISVVSERVSKQFNVEELCAEVIVVNDKLNVVNANRAVVKTNSGVVSDKISLVNTDGNVGKSIDEFQRNGEDCGRYRDRMNENGRETFLILVMKDNRKHESILGVNSWDENRSMNSSERAEHVIARNAINVELTLSLTVATQEQNHIFDHDGISRDESSTDDSFEDENKTQRGSDSLMVGMAKDPFFSHDEKHQSDPEFSQSVIIINSFLFWLRLNFKVYFDLRHLAELLIIFKLRTLSPPCFLIFINYFKSTKEPVIGRS